MNTQLAENNFIFVPSLISAEEARRLAYHFELEVDEIGTLNDCQVNGSPSVCDYRPFIKLQLDLLPKLDEITGLRLLPTYNYARTYKHGAVLDRHIDRAACEISVTLNLSKTVDWPICIQKPNGEEVCLELQPGEGMVYLGCVAEHWRDAYEGHKHTQVFFHYVNADGQRWWAYYDKRK